LSLRLCVSAVDFLLFIIDELVKSRHSRLSGVISPYNALKKKDSGQAGMTVPLRFSTFYKTIIILNRITACLYTMTTLQAKP
jgi:hypothetical protein